MSNYVDSKDLLGAESNGKKYFEVKIRDSSCDEEDKSYTRTVYYKANNEKEIINDLKGKIDDHFEWIKSIKELESLPERHGHKVVEL